MVDFIRKRLQVFVSSTYSDLKSERQAAVEAILSHGHIPAGMELFTSGDESQMEVIKQWIEESDVFLLILGGRYGSIEPSSGKSYTHLEYEHAIAHNKPYFACVLKESAQENRVKEYGSQVIEVENPKELKEFRQLVESKIVQYWEDCKDIQLVVGNKLSSLARREDLVGWVRADQITADPSVAQEIARLSKENEQLRFQISNIGTEELLNNGLSFDETVKALEEKPSTYKILGSLARIGDEGSEDIISDELVLLRKLGLITYKGSDPYAEDDDYLIIARITNSGFIFLNKLGIQKKLQAQYAQTIDSSL